MALKVSLAISGISALTLAIIMPLRLHTLWRRIRPAQINMTCEDPQSLKFRLLETVKSAGYQAPVDTNSGFTLEPANWRRKLGATPIVVSFPEPRKAIIMGPAMALFRPAKSFGVPVVAMPGSGTFGSFLLARTKIFAWIIGAMFVVIFVAYVAINPPRGGHKNDLSPGELETPTFREH